MKNKTSQRGSSLIEFMLLAAAGFIVVATIANSIVVQDKELNRVKLKLELSDIQYDAHMVMANTTTCLPNLTGITIDTTQFTNPAYEITLPRISDGAVELFAVNGPVLNIPLNQTVTKIAMTNWREIQPDQYKFELKVSLTTSVGPLAPLSIPDLIVNTNSGAPPTAKTVQSCSTDDGSARPLTTCRFATTGVASYDGQVVTCAADETAVSGGGSCVKADGSGDDEPLSMLHSTFPLSTNQWAADCYKDPGASGDGHVQAWALCCK